MIEKSKSKGPKTRIISRDAQEMQGREITVYKYQFGYQVVEVIRTYEINKFSADFHKT